MLHNGVQVGITGDNGGAVAIPPPYPLVRSSYRRAIFVAAGRSDEGISGIFLEAPGQGCNAASGEKGRREGGRTYATSH